MKRLSIITLIALFSATLAPNAAHAGQASDKVMMGMIGGIMGCIATGAVSAAVAGAITQNENTAGRVAGIACGVGAVVAGGIMAADAHEAPNAANLDQIQNAPADLEVAPNEAQSE